MSTFKTYDVKFKLVAGEVDAVTIRVSARSTGEAYSEAYKKVGRRYNVVAELMYIGGVTK